VNEYAEVNLAALAEDKYGEQNGREVGAVEDEGWREVSGSPSRTATTTMRMAVVIKIQVGAIPFSLGVS
jgi:hypothetical protein